MDNHSVESKPKAMEVETYFGSGVGIPPVGLQTQEWHLSRVVIGHANNISVLMAGVAGIVWFPLFSYWGRAPVLFWSSLMGLLFTLGCALAPNFHTFYALRAFQTLTQAVGQTIGLAMIKDMFFLHEHARKIGIWYSIFIASPLLGPLIGNFMIAGLGKWRPVFWLVVAWSGNVICLILVFGDESFYNRSSAHLHQQPERGTHLFDRLERVVGIWQIRNHKGGYFPTLSRCCLSIFKVFLKPVIPLSMCVVASTFMWSVGINVSTAILLQSPVHEAGYGFDARSTGFVYFAPVVGVVIGEIFGHFFNDFIATRSARRHGGRFLPEVRLRAVYVGAAIMIPGLILVGQTLEHHLHWAGIVFGWGLVQVGILNISVAMVTYVLDSYPNASGEVSALVNFARVGAGFSVGYFQQAWGEKQGLDVSFGIQAALVAAAMGNVVILQVYGASLRSWAGPVVQH
ncbi:major facilitator superfamily domain-containing protein [Aspergillus pseudoustus]|uniref:Major facilitator superfamily domain-containing protein n=1 Tax=Aspergillus pseudoustus TaxID=1810923 RepID=A0ABR4JU50_9EURO